MFDNFILEQISKKVGRKIEADECSMNQMTGEIIIRNLRVYNPEGTQIQATLESGHAKLNVMDLFQKKVTVENAEISSLKVNNAQ